ncbi:MAG: hypothetical protein ACYDH1_02145 [Anaerolineaceae bacterium]
MRKFALLFMIVFVSSTIISACAGGDASNAAGKSAEAYLNALVARDGDKMSTLSCAEWEENALLELDSFMAVDAALQDMTCSQTGTDGEKALVTCQGKIITTYNQEKSEIDLSSRTYEMTQSAGEWLVCGYH